MAISDTPGFVPFGGDEFSCHQPEKAGIVVLPVCYEDAPSYGSGSGNGANHILEASIQLEDTDEETWTHWYQKGIYTHPPLVPAPDPEQAMLEIQNAASKILQQKQFLLALGGDHAVTIGLVAAAALHYPEVGVLQIDAHLDLRDSWNGSRYNHACVMRRIHADYRLEIAQVGIRSFSSEEAAYVKMKHLSPWLAHKLQPAHNVNWISEVIDRLPPVVYITLDVDGLDPAVVPGTGTPEPGGLSYRQVVELIRQVGQSRRVIAADITELAKIPGCQVSEFTAARLAAKFFVYCT